MWRNEVSKGTTVLPHGLRHGEAWETVGRCCDRDRLLQGIHSLRHSLAHHLLDAGAPLPVVQKSLRHRSIGSTGVYLEADGRDVDQLAGEGDHRYGVRANTRAGCGAASIGVM
jgi:integrase